ncbi:hypothetical protein VQ045_21735, partial [Aurantimonas sp. E1-2-R+4]|uniref:hypothetical protein n=1 Tax=Aurantimonas sp. E1-2-R+4 TaxID=3113714 RepID=UPI002F9530BD
FPRFAFVHIASMPSSNQINSMESQTIHIIQLLCGPTLSAFLLVTVEIAASFVGHINLTTVQKWLPYLSKS